MGVERFGVGAGKRSAMDRRLQAINEAIEQCKKELLERYVAAGEAAEDDVLTLDEVERITCDVRSVMSNSIAKELTQAEADIERKKEMEEGGQVHKCERCHAKALFRGERVRSYVTMGGEVKVARRSYYCSACGHCTVPIDTQLALPQHIYTREVERWIGRLSAQDTFAGATKMLRELGGVIVSTKQAERVAIEMGQWVDEQVKQDVEKVLPVDKRSVHLRGYRPEELGTQLQGPEYTGYVFMDGAMTPIKGEGWKETKTSAVCLTKGRVVRKEEGAEQQPELLKRFYVQHLGGVDQFGERVLAMSARAGICKLPRLAVLGDGASWIWRIAREQFPHSQQILDWYHALEHLYEVARVCLSKPGLSLDMLSKQVEKWVKPVKKLMWNGCIEQVIECIHMLRAVTPEARDKIKETIGYYQNNRQRMQYAHYRSRGFWIGSGQAESACKRIVTFRLKGTGMRWSQTGAQAIGNLRALSISDGLWDSLMSLWPGTRRRCAAAS